jgi:Icc-related predicted phosphoesterase
MFRRRSKEQEFVIFFGTDLHGSEKCFLKFLNAAKFYSADGLILGGDMTGKGFVPVVQENGGYRADFLGRTEHATAGDELVELEKQIRFNGFYPYRCDADELGQLRADPDYLARVFQRVIRDEVERWVGIADDRVAAAGVPCVMMSGNDDDTYVDEILSSAKVVRNVDGAVVEFGPYQVMGFGYSNPTPWNSPRELPEPEIEIRLQRVAQEIDSPARAIFNIHVPPYNSSLDLAPKLKDDLSFATTGSQPHTVPVGSTAVRQLIEERQPLLALHGHVHESRAASRIGATLCINPGSEYNNGILRGAIVRLSGEKVRGYQFVNG